MDPWSVQGDFERNQQQKLEIFALRKKGREKTQMAKRALKSVAKKRVNF